MLLSSCTLFQLRGQRIVWPDQIRYMEAMCDLDMSWKGMKYSGSMSLILNYPSQLHMEVYGPFGNTLMFLKKDGDDFLLVTKEERFTEASFFEDRFGFKIREFMDDIARIAEKDSAGNEQFVVQREEYRVLYTLKNKKNTICWESKEGSICIKFLDVKFE
jgi:hypothetical protein